MVYICAFLLVVLVAAFMIGFILGLKFSNKETMDMYQLSVKHMEYFKLAIKWIKNPDKIADYMDIHGYTRVGVYGMSYLGDCLVEVLRKQGIKVVYGIDRNAEKIYNPYIPIYHLEDELPSVDIIVVTAVISYQQIKRDLENVVKGAEDIISLEHLLHM